MSFNTAKEEQVISLTVSDKDVVINEYYTDRPLNAVEHEDGSYKVTLQISSIEDSEIVFFRF